MSELLERFRTAYRNLQLLPLLKKEELDFLHDEPDLYTLEDGEEIQWD